MSPEYRERFQPDPQAAAKFYQDTAVKQQALYTATQPAKQRINAKTAETLDRQDKEVQTHKDQDAIAHFSLDAHETGSGRAVEHNWETNYGSYDRNFYAGKRLFVSIHDLARSSARCVAEVNFIARTLADHTLCIYDRRLIRLNMEGGIEVKGEVDAPELKSNVQNYAALRQRYVSGAEIFGWVVVGKVGPQAFGMRASNQTLQDIASDPKTWDSSIEDYDKSFDERK